MQCSDHLDQPLAHKTAVSASNICNRPQTPGGVTTLFFRKMWPTLNPCNALMFSNSFHLEKKLCILRCELLCTTHVADTSET